MPAPTPFVDHCLELLGSAGAPRARRMFGGHGLYVDELFVAIVARERLYLKADAQTRERFERAGCEPFVYTAQGRSVSLGYWSAPDDAMESPAAMQPWVRLALEAALRARQRPGAPAACRQRTTGRAKATR
jgi:DNA transformation protein